MRALTRILRAVALEVVVRLTEPPPASLPVSRFEERSREHRRLRALGDGAGWHADVWADASTAPAWGRRP